MAHRNMCSKPARVVQGLAYVVAFVASAALSTVACQRLLLWLPSGPLGLIGYIVVVAAIAACVTMLESAVGWKHWLQPRDRSLQASGRANSRLLTGHAPLPLGLGVAVGALLALSAW